MKYICDPRIIPTNTCPPDISELEKRSVEFAHYSHEVQLDVSDGVFSPVLSWPYVDGQLEMFTAHIERGGALPHSDTLEYEVHLMVKDPARVGALFARAGAKRLLPHLETMPEPEAARALFDEWRRAGAKEIGLSLLLDTPLEAYEPYAGQCDYVQLMSIANIGAQGEPFQEGALSRVEELHAKHPDLLVSVDGGVSEENIEELVRAGANRLCVGSALSKSSNPAQTYAHIHERAMLGCAPLPSGEVAASA